jgi:hypothetical protein
MNRFLFGSAVLLMLGACQARREGTTAQLAVVKDSVTDMMSRISADITNGGPTKWLGYFEDDPAFYMTSDGAVKFPDIQSAITYTRDSLPHIISKIALNWKKVRVDPLTTEFASIGADFNEDLTLPDGQTLSFSGYFTAVAHFNGGGWKLRNLSWDVIPRQ